MSRYIDRYARRAPILWRRPREVVIDGAYLVADFEKGDTYPLLEAAKEGRALRALTKARSDEGVRQFTVSWGLLHYRLEGDRVEPQRYPLDLFQLHRQYFLALARLSQTVRDHSNEREECVLALTAVRDCKMAIDICTYGFARVDSNLEAARQALFGGRLPDLRSILTKEESAVEALGVPAIELLKARHENRAVPIQQYAARTLAAELAVQWKTDLREQAGHWELDEQPEAYTLLQVFRWTFRSHYRVLRHYLCQGCGAPAMSYRDGARWCSPECGSNSRVWRHRHKPSDDPDAKPVHGKACS